MNVLPTSRTLLRTLALAALLVALPAAAADGAKTKVKGLITAVQGNTITIKDESSAVQTFTVGADTVYKETKGLTGVVHEKSTQAALIPGLPVTVEAVPGGDGLAATEVSFKSEDLKVARQVQAGLEPTTARMDAFGSYEALETVEVLFASGSTALSAQAKSDLTAFAAKAKEVGTYQVVMQGFTDSTGNAAANQRLSVRRANAVANFLQQSGGLAPGRVRAGDGMGVAPDAGAGSNAGARKVVVKLVVDKGVQAGKAK